MREFNFYSYDEEKDKINLYCEEINNYFDSVYNIDIKSIDFDENQNVILFVEHMRNKLDSSELEKELLKEIEHLNDVEVRNMKIVLAFDSKEIELF